MRHWFVSPAAALVCAAIVCTSCAETERTPPPKPKLKTFVIPNADYPVRPDGTKNEGVVVVHACVNELGVLTSATVVSSSGFDDLDAAAVATIKNGRYKAGVKDGKPFASCKDLRITYKGPQAGAKAAK